MSANGVGEPTAIQRHPSPYGRNSLQIALMRELNVEKERQMNFKFSGIVAGIALAAAAAGPVAAAEFFADIFDGGAVWNSNFDGDPPNHYFYFDGARVDQTYAGTGLAAANSISLAIPFDLDTAEDLGFTISLNGIDVGTWLLAAGADAAAFANLAYSFAPISANAGNSFTVGLRVTQPVCVGCGSVNLNQVGRISLSDGGAGAVPEPASWALLILGFGAAGAMLRQRRLAAI